MANNDRMDRNLALEAVRVTEAAALSASRLMGRGDEKAADQAAVDAMRQALNSLSIDGTVVIGEGERDEAPMLFIGEKVGTGQGPKIDIARSRNSEYNLFRAQREKPMSLARQRTAASPEVSSGYQVIIRKGEAEAPLARLRNNTSGITNADAKEMTNQGMI